MKVFKYALGEMQANCYFLVKEKNCLIIDPGDNADFLLEEISRQNLNLCGMIATHGHFDHIMGSGSINISTSEKLKIDEKDNFLVKRLSETVKHFLGYDAVVIIPTTEPLKEGSLKISNFKFEIISTPGHTPGSSCFLFADDDTVFTGDTLFKNGVGRYDFSYSSKEDLKNSLEKLFQLPEEFLVYPGHGDETVLVSEKERAFKFI